jgi:hypothetical protein
MRTTLAALTEYIRREAKCNEFAAGRSSTYIVENQLDKGQSLDNQVAGTNGSNLEGQPDDVVEAESELEWVDLEVFDL